MFPEPTELLLIGYLIESFWTTKIQIKYIVTKNQLADIQTKGNFTRDEWNHLLCLSNISHFSSINSLKPMSKRTQEDAGEERVTAMSKPMMNLVSRYSVRDPNVLASTASESPGKTRSESQKVLVGSLNEQQGRTGRLVPAHQTTQSETLTTSCFLKWKSGEMLGVRTRRPVDDKFVVDDDMDSNTVIESNLSLKSRWFLNRVNDRLRKILDQSSKDALQDMDKCSMIWLMFVSSTLEASVFMRKNYSDNLHSIKHTGKDLTLKQMFDISEKLIVEQSDEIFGVSQIRWEDTPWNNHLWSMMKKSSVFRLQRCMYFSDSVFCLDWMNQKPESNIVWEEQSDWFKDSPQYRTLDTIDGEPMEFEWNMSKDSPRCSSATKSKGS